MNTLKTKILGSNAVITTPILFEDLLKVAKIKPEALSIKNEKGAETYKIAVKQEGVSDLGKYGATFASKDAEGFAQLNIKLDEHLELEERLHFIKENYGYAIMKLNTALEEIEANIAVVKEELNQISENIEIVG